ncbi:hypothetical protein FB45DRAFT_931000 [Roridomyces roridus]|uniref:Uncharacterized protein n=1 Tax=Roridomyces roridus TaxID=1738132 RepID=A0AAD7BFM0_9AGAR|nr:hypothetical protein FB45DRAFT_931000 [Roridomyces roridus]
MLIVAVGDSDREVTEEVCRTQGHQDFVKEAIIGEFLAIVYLHVGNKDVRSDFGSDSGGEGVSRQAFFEGFIQMQVQDDWRDFWAHFKPDDQIAWKVEGRDFKNFCRPQTPHVIKERNSTVHDITLRNIHDVLVSMKQAGEYHSAHMLEQLCCAVTDTPYSDSWFRDDRKVKQLAELVRNRFPLLKPVATVDETDQKSRNLNTAIKIHEAAKKFEEKRKDDARAAWKKGVEAKGFCEISGADLIRDDIRQLKLLGAGLAAVVACLAYSRWAAK